MMGGLVIKTHIEQLTQAHINTETLAPNSYPIFLTQFSTQN